MFGFSSVTLKTNALLFERKCNVRNQHHVIAAFCIDPQLSHQKGGERFLLGLRLLIRTLKGVSGLETSSLFLQKVPQSVYNTIQDGSALYTEVLKRPQQSDPCIMIHWL